MVWCVIKLNIFFLYFLPNEFELELNYYIFFWLFRDSEAESPPHTCAKYFAPTTAFKVITN